LYDSSYEDMASKFFEHFVFIVDAMNASGGLWDDVDGFYYDKLQKDNKSSFLRVRSMVGLMPLYACLVLEHENMQNLKEFKKRTEWFLKNKPNLSANVTFKETANDNRVLLAIPSKEQLLSLLKYLLDENEFLSPYGIRSLSKIHENQPYIYNTQDGHQHRVDYMPGESNNNMFGGNSNWRGPIWICVNFLIIEALERYDYFYQDDILVECPTGSGNKMRLKEVAKEISRRLVSLFEMNTGGGRACHDGNKLYMKDDWKELLLFHEYFHAETGRGCGASHQTGWTALVINCIKKLYE